MRPGARIQAAIEIVEAIEASLKESGAAADQIIQHYFRSRRYAGSKDRRAVIDMVYAVLRGHGERIWRLEQAGLEINGRNLVLLSTGSEPLDPDDPHGPAPLSDAEGRALMEASALMPENMPDHARYNVPDWLMPVLRDAFGKGLAAEMTAHQGRAPLDVRVNTLKGTSEEVVRAFPEANPGQWSPWSLRLPTRTTIQQSDAYQSGLIEIQDEGSQVAALLTGARPGDQVLDLCAGGGGKTLAMAAMMENSGQLYAYDKDQRKLNILRERARRPSVKNINYIKQIEEFDQTLDRAVLDVPCSGSGTWRRNPDLRWRLTPDRLQDLTDTQNTLLDQGAGMVKPGGQITYITCSLLPQEGEDRIAAFLDRHEGFRLLPYGQNWPLDDRNPPPTRSSNPACLRMSPLAHQTDGFFVAVLERLE